MESAHIHPKITYLQAKCCICGHTVISKQNLSVRPMSLVRFKSVFLSEKRKRQEKIDSFFQESKVKLKAEHRKKLTLNNSSLFHLYNIYVYFMILFSAFTEVCKCHSCELGGEQMKNAINLALK